MAVKRVQPKEKRKGKRTTLAVDYATIDFLIEKAKEMGLEDTNWDEFLIMLAKREKEETMTIEERKKFYIAETTRMKKKFQELENEQNKNNKG